MIIAIGMACAYDCSLLGGSDPGVINRRGFRKIISGGKAGRTHLLAVRGAGGPFAVCSAGLRLKGKGEAVIQREGPHVASAVTWGGASAESLRGCKRCPDRGRVGPPEGTAGTQ